MTCQWTFIYSSRFVKLNSPSYCSSLSSNPNLVRLPNDLFSNLAALKTVTITGTKIAYFPGNPGATKLATVDLGSNSKLETIHRSAFSAATKSV